MFNKLREEIMLQEEREIDANLINEILIEESDSSLEDLVLGNAEEDDIDDSILDAISDDGDIDLDDLVNESEEITTEDGELISEEVDDILLDALYEIEV